MTKYNGVNVKLTNSQLNPLKSTKKNSAKVLLRLSSNMIDNSNDETNFVHKLLLTDRQVTSFPNAFANSWSADVELSKNQIFKLIQLVGFILDLNPLRFVKKS